LPTDVTTWGEFGETSEVGALNYISSTQVRQAAALVTAGKVFTLGLPVFNPQGDPVSRDRPGPMHVVYRDWSHYTSGQRFPIRGGLASVDDGIFLSCHATTHIDALGHVIADGQLWDGKDAALASPGLRWASIAPLGRRGICTRGVLVDVAGALGLPWLAPRQQVTFGELLEILDQESVEVAPGDVLLLRTGSLERFYRLGAEEFFHDYSEPGLTYEADLVEWFRRERIAGLGTDTLANELPESCTIDADYPLHRYVMRDLGVTFHEALDLAALAEDCRDDNRYLGLYVASPLKAVGVSASPVNPLFVK
jgi:kynurenine formamidase